MKKHPKALLSGVRFGYARVRNKKTPLACIMEAMLQKIHLMKQGG